MLSLRDFGRDIMVVIVGVLVALGVNSWATERGDRTLEKQYLERLARDFRQDSLALAEFRRSAELGQRAGLELLALLEGSSEAPDTHVSRLLGDATRDAYLIPNTPTIEDLKSSGNLRVIEDATIRDAVLSYYSQVSGYQRVLETLMRRGKDPLGELGWDIGGFDPDISFAVGRGTDTLEVASAPAMYDQGSLLSRFQNRADAERVTRRAITYNSMLQTALSRWERSLLEARTKIVD